MSEGKSFKEILKGINEYFLILLFIATILVLSLQVISRTFFSTAFPWAEEVSRYLFIYFVFGGAAIAFGNGVFISVDVLSKLFSKRFQLFLSLFISIIELIFFLSISYLGIDLFMGSSGQLTPALEIEIKYIYLAIPIFSLQMSYYSLKKINSLLQKVNKSEGIQ